MLMEIFPQSYIRFLFSIIMNTYYIIVRLLSYLKALFKLFNLNFHLLQVVSRYRDTQLQLGEKDSYLCDLRPNV